jgi:hypothetical protein
MYLEVAVLDAGGISQHVSVKVRVLLRRAVVTAQRAVDAGAVISGQDIVMREMTFDRLVGTGIRPGSAGCRAAGEAVHSGRHVAPGGSARAGSVGQARPDGDPDFLRRAGGDFHGCALHGDGTAWGHRHGAQRE